jgi:hypothetical protein
LRSIAVNATVKRSVHPAQFRSAIGSRSAVDVRVSAGVVVVRVSAGIVVVVDGVVIVVLDGVVVIMGELAASAGVVVVVCAYVRPMAPTTDRADTVVMRNFDAFIAGTPVDSKEGTAPENPMPPAE